MNWNHPVAPVLATAALALVLWGLKQFVDSRVRAKTTELWAFVRDVERKRGITATQLRALGQRHEALRVAYRNFKANFRSKGYVYNPDGSPININENDDEVE